MLPTFPLFCPKRQSRKLHHIHPLPFLHLLQSPMVSLILLVATPPPPITLTVLKSSSRYKCISLEQFSV